MLRLILSIIMLVLASLTSHIALGYVFLGPNKPRLKPDDGRYAYFHITPEAPRFMDAENFENGAYADNSDPQIFASIVERAMSTWNSIPSLGIELKLAEKSLGKIDDTDNQFSIGIGQIDTLASGLAYPVTDEADPTRIRDCDIQVGEHVKSIPQFLFVMIHELGHCLGLGHNHSDPSAIMGYWQPRGVVQLGLDDMAGVLSLYPPQKGERTTAFAPCGALASRGLNRIRDTSGVHHNLYQTHGSVYRSAVFAMGLIPALFWGVMVVRPWSYRRRLRRFVP